MSETVDTKVLQMKFDNKEFENNVRTTMSTLDKLKEKLNFRGSSQGLEDVETGFDKSYQGANKLSEGIVQVQEKFNALKTIGETVLANITNSAVDAGTKILKAFTIDPISSGFSEYQMKIDSVQTILSNTQARAKDINKKTIEELNAGVETSTAEMKKANEKAIEDLKETHSKAVKDFNKEATLESRSFNKQISKDTEAFNKQLSDQTQALNDSLNKEMQALQDNLREERQAKEKELNEELKAYTKTFNKETEAFEKELNKQTKAFNKAQQKEMKDFREAHNEKLASYKKEYMEKLKATDEERYNEIKAIEDQINAINGLTEAENEEAEARARQEQLDLLQSNVDKARSTLSKKKAEEELAAYKEQLAREQLLKDRANQVKTLQQKIEDVKDEYDEKKKAMAEEYQQGVDNINSQYDIELEQFRDAQDAKREAFQDELKEKREAYQEEHNKQMELFREEQQEKRQALQDEQNEIVKALAEEQQAKREALQEQQKQEREAFNDQITERRDAFNDEQSAKREAMTKAHKEELKQMQERHKEALDNIKTERDAKIAALAKESEENLTKGSTLDDVNKALDELNTYADKTIYNFAQMTRNIGTFTAAGIDLDTSVSSIKGIANLAAVSGSTANQASSAMYQISQALASGKVNLQDWNSIVNAGMGGKVFQDSLKETAKVHGVAIDQIIAKNGSFRESLKEDWLTSDVLTETLRKFTGDMTEAELSSLGYNETQIKNIQELGQMANDAATKVKSFSQLMDTLQEAAQSGWTESWEYMIGDFEGAKKVWTEMSDFFSDKLAESAKTRNDFIKDVFTNNWEKIRLSIRDTGVSVGDFQNKLIDVGKKHGVVTDEMIEKAGGFEESLKNGWLNADILREAFAKMSDEELKNMGYNEDAIKKFRELADSAQDAKSPISNLFTDLDKMSGREMIFETILNFAKGIYSVFDAIKKAMSEQMPTGLADSVKNAIEKVHDFSEKLIISEETARKITDTFDGVFAVFRLIGDIVKEIAKPIGDFLSNIFSLSGKALDFTAQIGKYVENAVKAYEQSGKLSKISESLASAFDWLKDAIKGVVDWLKQLFGGLGDNITANNNFMDSLSKINPLKIFSDAVEKLVTWLRELLNLNKGATDSLGDVGNKFQWIGNIADFVKEAAAQAFDVFKNLVGYLGKFLRSREWEDLLVGIRHTLVEYSMDSMTMTFRGTVNNLLKSVQRDYDGIIKKFADKFKEGVDTLMESFDDITESFTKNITKLLDSVGNSLKDWSTGIKAEAILKIAEAVGILAAALWVVAQLDLEQVGVALAGITGLIAELLGAFYLFDRFLNTSDFTSDKKGIAGVFEILKKGLSGLAQNAQMAAVSTLLVSLAGSITLLAVAMKLIGDLPIENIVAATAAIGALMFMLLEAVKSIKGMEAGVGEFKSMAIIVVVTGVVSALGKVMQELGQLSVQQTAVAVAALGGILLEIKLFAEAVSDMQPAQTLRGAMQISQIANAIKTLAGAATTLAELSWEDLVKGLAGVGILLTELQLFLNNLDAGNANKFTAPQVTKYKKWTNTITETSYGIIIIANAISKLVESVKLLGELNFDTLLKGLGGVGVLLAEIRLYINSFEEDKNLLKTAISMAAIAGTLELYADVVKRLGNLDFDQIVKGLGGMGGILLEVCLALKALEGIDGIKSVGFGMIEVGAALELMAGALKKVGELSLGQLVIGLAGLGGVLAEIALAIGVFSANQSGATSMIVASTALLELGIALKLVGSMSLAEIATGLIAIAGAFGIMAAAAVLVGPLTPVIASLAISMEMLGLAMVEFSASLLITSIGLEKICRLWSNSSEIMVEALDVIGRKILDFIPYLFKKIGEALIEFMRAIGDNVEVFGEELLKILVECAKVIKEGTPLLVDIVLDFIIGIIQGCADRIDELVFAVVELFGNFFEACAKALSAINYTDFTKGLLQVTIMTSILSLLGELTPLLGAATKGVLMFTAITAEMTAALAALGAIYSIPGVEDFVNKGSKLVENIGGAIGGFFGGIIGGVMKGISDSMPTVGRNIKIFGECIEPFLDTVSKLDGNIEGNIKSLASGLKALMDAANSGDLLSKWTGQNKSLSEFGREIASLGKSLAKYHESIAEIFFPQLQMSAIAIKSMSMAFRTIPDSGGWLDIIFGNKYKDFFDHLIIIGNALKDYYKSIKDIETEVIITSSVALTSLCMAMVGIPSEGGFLTKLINGDRFENFANGIQSIGAGLKNYYESIKDIKTIVILDSSTAVTSLLMAMVKIPYEGGFITKLFTGDRFTNFAGGMKNIGGGLKDYYTAIKDTNPGKIKDTASALKSLINYLKDCPTGGGWISTLFGLNDIKNFGGNLVNIGNGLKKYYEEVKDVNKYIVSETAESIGILADVLSKCPKNGGWIETFFGLNDIKNFGGNLVNIGGGLKDFYDATKNILTEQIEVCANAIETLITTLSKVPSGGGWIDTLFGQNDIKNFGGNLVNIGVGLKDFYDVTSGIDPESCKSAASALKNLIDSLKDVPTEGGWIDTLFGENNITNFASNLVNIGNALVDFHNTVKEASSTVISDAVDSLNSILGMVNTIPESLGDVSGLAGGMTSLGAAISDFNGSVSQIENFETVTTASNTLKTVIETLKDVPSSGGLFNNDYTHFGTGFTFLGQCLNEFSKQVSGAEDGVQIDHEKVQQAAASLKQLMEAVKDIPTSGGFIGMLLGKEEADFAGFGGGMRYLGEALKEFHTSVKGIDTATVYAGSDSLYSLITTLSEVPTNGGLWKSLVEGTKDYSGTAEGLKALGKGVKAFHDEVVGLDKEIVQEMAYALGSLLSELSKVPLKGSLKDMFDGVHDYDAVADGLEILGRAMRVFYYKVYDLNEEILKMGTNCLLNFMQAISQAPTTGGLISLQEGSINFEWLAYGISTLADGLVNFDSKLTNVDFERLKVGVTSLKQLLVTLSETPNDGGLLASGVSYDKISSGFKKLSDGLAEFDKNVAYIIVDKIREAKDVMVEVLKGMAELDASSPVFTDENIALVANKAMSELGQGVASFCSNVAQVKIDDFSEGIEKLKELFDTMKLCPDLDSEDNPIINFSTSIKKLAGAINSFQTTLSEIGYDNISKACAQFRVIITTLGSINEQDIETVNEFTTALGDLATEGVQAFVDECKVGQASVITAIRDMMDVFGKEITDYTDDVEDAAEELVTAFNDTIHLNEDVYFKAGTYVTDKFVRGIKYLEKDVNTAAKKISDSGVKTLNDLADNFKRAGNGSGGHFAEGIAGTEQKNKTSAQRVGKEAARALEDTKDDFKRSGEKAGGHFGTGLASYEHETYEAGVKLAGKGAEGASSGEWDFYDAGRNAGQGYINGLESLMDGFRRIGRTVAEASSEAVRIILDEHSPSKLWHSFGSNAAQGFINGVESLIGQASKTSEDLALSSSDAVYNEADFQNAGKSNAKAYSDGLAYRLEEMSAKSSNNVLNALRQSAAKLGMFIDDKFGELRPTITPVLDMSEVEKSLDKENLMINEASSMMAGYSNAIIQDLGNMAVDIKMNNENKDAITREYIRAVANDMANSFSNTIAQMRLYLDSGQLVGGVAEKMDRQLGFMYAKAKRGI